MKEEEELRGAQKQWSMWLLWSKSSLYRVTDSKRRSVKRPFKVGPQESLPFPLTDIDK